MSDQTDVLQGTLDLLILRTMALEPMHGWAIAQRIQQISDDQLRVQQGSLYPALHRLEHQGWITAEWGSSENNRRARFYALTKAGRKQLDAEVAKWQRCRPASPSCCGGPSHAPLAHPPQPAAIAPVPRWPRVGPERRAAAPPRTRDRPSAAGGLSHEEARRQARRLFGGVEAVKEASREARGIAAWDALVRDTRHGLRRLAHDWRFTAAAVLILGLGIGVTTAMFSLVNAVLFRDQVFPNPDRVVNIYQNDREGRPVGDLVSRVPEMAEYGTSSTASWRPASRMVSATSTPAPSTTA